MTANNDGNDDSGAGVSRLDGLRELLATGKPVKVRRAMGELVAIPDDGTALAVAARFAETAALSSEVLLKLWPQSSDPDGFCAACSPPPPPSPARTGLRYGCAG
ncbi:hypothetical protein [Streptomyces sp. N50]|uniref:hypothetical protein n=1 Tax=Streptomyces sp. N50 TaxID=3081765 RepID=UPI0029622139|nr:hypothetical protein [Streptomyces sp. N50]WOX07370.1 hypothetical protein R2B38_00185 [Streptomyces sp. N50]